MSSKIRPIPGACELCNDTGIVPIEGCTCAGADLGYAHEIYCGREPCPSGCEVNWQRLEEMHR